MDNQMRDQMNDQWWNELGEEIEPVWAPEREWAIRAAITRRVARRRMVARTAVAVASTGVIAVGALALVKWQSAVPSARPSVSGASSAGIAPAAGGATESITVTQLSPDTVLAPLPDRNGRGFALNAGGARFSVPHDNHRTFVVAAGEV